MCVNDEMFNDYGFPFICKKKRLKKTLGTQFAKAENEKRKKIRRNIVHKNPLFVDLAFFGLLETRMFSLRKTLRPFF